MQKRLIPLLILLLVSFLLLASCTVEETNQPPPNNGIHVSNVERNPFVMPEELVGQYKHHRGETTEGRISISNDVIIIEITGYIYVIQLTADNIQFDPNCVTVILVTADTGEVIKITPYIETQGLLNVYINGVYAGTYDKIKNEQILN